MTVTAVKVHDIIHDPPLIDVVGATVLVDRLWPRGVAKTQFTPDYLLKDVLQNFGNGTSRNLMLHILRVVRNFMS